MSIIRQDPTTREWVIIAAERNRRPHEHPRPVRTGSQPPDTGFCPFCPGHEASTPDEVLRVPGSGGTGWAVRVISNKFPALGVGGGLERREPGPLFREMDGVGTHEVVIETPSHERSLPLMTDREVAHVLLAYQARYRSLRRDPRLKYIIIFKNHGEAAGTSLAHPHSQLVATPVPPMLLRRKYEVAVAHYDDTGRCLYCDIAEEERKAKSRVVLETDWFLVFHPFASRVPFETWITPKRHQPSFGQVSEEDLRELAPVLRRTLRALYDRLGDPDFNYIIHSAPAEDENKDYYLWHIQILPRLTTIAGFELGSGIYVSTMRPEDSAAVIRDHEQATAEQGSA
ncbi:MAG: galactose-1-phosphate uridylyltransferase [Nitrospira sp.]|nr:galactose-1-phosphate uridylyltransferase [Nitrospira sp.]